MKFNPNFILTGIDGKPMEGEIDVIHAGKILAQSLFYATDNRIKFHGWALKLYSMMAIDLDDADKELLKNFIEKSKFPAVTYTALINTLNKIEEVPSENGKAKAKEKV